MLHYVFILLLCSYMSSAMQQPSTNQFDVAELPEEFDHTKPSITTNPVHFINTTCMFIQLNLASCIPSKLSDYLPLDDAFTKPIVTHLLLQAVSSTTSCTKDYVKQLLALGANPLDTQQISSIQQNVTYVKQNATYLQNERTLYNVQKVHTVPSETPLRMAMQYRNVPAVKAMLEQQPMLALTQLEHSSNQRTYADYSAWLMEYAQETEELKQIHKLIQQALQKSTEGNE